MKDLIDRQAAIDAIFSEPLYESGMKKRDADAVVPAIYEKIKSLPSTETHEERAKTHACDLIDRQAAIDAFLNVLGIKNPNWFLNQTEKEVYDALKALPSVQPDIIHCKDCKHWMPYDWMFSEVWQSKNMDDYPEKEIGCQYCDMNMSANDFCSRPERRTDEA